MDKLPFSFSEHQAAPPQHHVPRHAMPAYGHDDGRHHQHESVHQQPIAPQPVVQVLSPRGIEYVFLTITLFIGAFGLGASLIAMANDQFHFAVLVFPLVCLLVTIPIFSWLFLRLKQAELADPALRTDPSKRRTTQFTQVVAFIITLFTMIGLITLLMAKIAGEYKGGTAQLILNGLIILLIAGGILAYYWHDEHRA